MIIKTFRIIIMINLISMIITKIIMMFTITMITTLCHLPCSSVFVDRVPVPNGSAEAVRCITALNQVSPTLIIIKIIIIIIIIFTLLLSLKS